MVIATRFGFKIDANGAVIDRVLRRPVTVLNEILLAEIQVRLQAPRSGLPSGRKGSARKVRFQGSPAANSLSEAVDIALHPPCILTARLGPNLLIEQARFLKWPNA